MDQPDPLRHVPSERYGKAALVISIIALLVALSGYVIGFSVKTTPMVEQMPAELMNSTTTVVTPPTPTERWYSVRSLPLGTKRGAIQLRHECDIPPQTIDSEAARMADSGTICTGRNRVILVDTLGRDRVIIPPISLPSGDEGKRLAPHLYASVQDFSQGKQDVLISFDQDTCLNVGDCGLGDTSGRTTGTYSVDKDEFTAFEPFSGPFDLIFWGGDRKALILQITCGGAACGALTPIHGYDLYTHTPKELTTRKADYDRNGGTTQSPSGEITPHWESVRWVDANRGEAVYVGIDGKKETIPLTF